MKPAPPTTQNRFLDKLDAIPGKYWLATLLVFIFLVFLAGLEARQLKNADEPRIAGISAEMVLTGNWLMPHLNGKVFTETPPLFFWSTALSLKLFGMNDFGAKLPAALSAIAGVLAVFLLLRKMRYSGFTAFLGGFLLATSLPYWGNGRKCMTDIMLAGFIALAMYGFYSLTQSTGFRRRLGWFLFFAASLGAALLSKALIGLGIPCSALFTWLLLDQIFFRKAVVWKHWLMLFGGALLALLPIGFWLWLVYRNYGYDVFHSILWTNNLGRFSGSHAQHIEPFYYYLEKIPLQFQPWTLLAWAGVLYHFHHAWKQRDRSSQSLFMLCWLLIPYLALTISAGKRNVYVLPLYGAEAMLTATFAHAALSLAVARKWLESRAARISFRLAGWLLIFTIPLLCLTGALCAPQFGFRPFMAWGPLFFIPALILWIRPGLLCRGAALLCAFAGLYIVIDTFLLTIDDSRESYKTVFMEARRRMEAEKTDGLYLLSSAERVQGAAVFYMGRIVPCAKLEEIEDIREQDDKALFIADGPHPDLEPTGVENVRVQLYRLKNTEHIEKDEL